MYQILFKYLENGQGLYQIKKATDGSAGFDLLAACNEEIIIKPNKSFLVPCGFAIQMPNDLEAQVRPRSGIALKNCVTVLNSPGTIDADYRGEICVILINHGTEDFIINRGMRIAQMIFMKLPNIQLVESKDLESSDRGSGGFGSTGIK